MLSKNIFKPVLSVLGIAAGLAVLGPCVIAVLIFIHKFSVKMMVDAWNWIP